MNDAKVLARKMKLTKRKTRETLQICHKHLALNNSQSYEVMPGLLSPYNMSTMIM